MSSVCNMWSGFNVLNEYSRVIINSPALPFWEEAICAFGEPLRSPICADECGRAELEFMLPVMPPHMRL